MGGVCVCLPQTRVFHFLAVSGAALLWKDSSVVVPGICKSHSSLFSCSITTGSTLNFTFYICSSFSVRPLYFLVFLSSSCCCCQLGLPHISLLLFSAPNQPPLCLVGWLEALTLTDPWLPSIHCLLSSSVASSLFQLVIWWLVGCTCWWLGSYSYHWTGFWAPVLENSLEIFGCGWSPPPMCPHLSSTNDDIMSSL